MRHGFITTCGVALVASFGVAAAIGWSEARAADEDPGDAYRVTVDLGDAIRLLGSDDAFQREPAEELLLNLDQQSLPALATALEREDAPVRHGVVEVLTSIDGPRATELLVERADGDSSIGVRAAAIEGLVSRDDPEAEDLVQAALESDDPRLYRSAFDGCASYCISPEQLDRIVAFAFSEPTAYFSKGPRGALLRAGADPSRRDDVLAALERGAAGNLTAPSAETRIRAGLLFYDIGDPRAEAGLNEAFADEAPHMLRLAALVGLGAVGDETTVERIAEARPGFPRGLQQVACKALGRLASRDVPRAAEEARKAGCPGAG